MAIKKIRLPDGTDAVIDEWLHWPLYSVIEWDLAAAPDLRAFTYVRGQRVPQIGLVARLASDTDTNMVTRGKINHDEAFIMYALTYEIFTKTNVDDAQSAPEVAAYYPMLTAANLKRLQRDLMVELYVGAGIRKPQLQMPFSWVGQSVGAPGFPSGDSDAVMALTYGTGGQITPSNQRRMQLPIYIESDRAMQLRLWNPGGVVTGLSQDVSIRWWLDGLKRRPVA